MPRNFFKLEMADQEAMQVGFSSKLKWRGINENNS